MVVISELRSRDKVWSQGNNDTMLIQTIVTVMNLGVVEGGIVNSDRK